MRPIATDAGVAWRGLFMGKRLYCAEMTVPQVKLAWAQPTVYWMCVCSAKRILLKR